MNRDITIYLPNFAIALVGVALIAYILGVYVGGIC